MFPREFFYQLEDTISRAAYDINERYLMRAFIDANTPHISVEAEPPTKARSMNLQGLASKMALLRHNLEAEAEKLGNRVDGAATKSTETFAKSHKFLDATDKDLADVESFIAELDAATNGAPK